MLSINGLQASVNDQAILKGVDLSINAGEVHAIMGPNGSGKSTLLNTLAGRDVYEVTQGTVDFHGKDLLSLSVEERSWLGLFLAFQYPVEVPGVNNMYFLKMAVNSLRHYRGEMELDAFDFMQLVKKTLPKVGLDERFLKRSVNCGFSGGEKKRNEILQMLMLQPSLALLDETDSGLDIDALKTIAEGVNMMRSPERSIVLVTHYQRLLDYVEPDFVHVMMHGKIVESGDKTLALSLEKDGYAWLQKKYSNEGAL